MSIQLDTIDYQDLLRLGFDRQDIEDDVCFRKNGYYGFNLFIEFPHINVGISSPCIAQNDGKQWDFQIYNVKTGDVIRKISLIEIQPLIELFKAKSYEIERGLNDVANVLKERSKNNE